MDGGEPVIAEATLDARPRDPSWRSIDWRFVARGLLTAGMIGAFAISSVPPLQHFLANGGSRLFIDARIYFRATELWIGGGNPWAAPVFDGTPFAAPPPSLLLNLPLLPLGETVAVGTWAALNTLAVGLLLYRLRLPIWWTLFLPVSEGWLSASPDLALAALALLGAGGISTLIKPYSIPALLADRRWRAVVLGLVAAVITIPLLPWGVFLDSRPAVEQAFREWGRPVSAFGDPLLMVLTALALVSLGWRRGLALTTPGLIAMQPHYLVFSLGTIARSPILAVPMTFAWPHVAAIGVIAYAIFEQVRTRGPRAWRRSDP